MSVYEELMREARKPARPARARNPRTILHRGAEEAGRTILARDLGHEDAHEGETATEYTERVGPVGSDQRAAHKAAWKAQREASQVDEGFLQFLKKALARRRERKAASAQEKAASRKEREDKEFEASVAKEPERTRDRLSKQGRLQQARQEQDIDPSVAGTDDPSKVVDPGEPPRPKRNGFKHPGNGNGMRISRDVSHTEYEGDTLSETRPAARRPAPHGMHAGVPIGPPRTTTRTTTRTSRSNPDPKGRPITSVRSTTTTDDPSKPMKTTPLIAHTEYEGPSLSEDGYSKKWRKPPRQKGATQEVVPKRPNLTQQQIKDLLDHIRRRGQQEPPTSRSAEAGAENASTEYEGPSLLEQLAYVVEGASKDTERRARILRGKAKRAGPPVKAGESEEDYKWNEAGGRWERVAPTGGSYPTYDQSTRERVRRLMNP